MTISATDILVPVCSKIPLLYLLTQKVAQKFGYVLGIFYLLEQQNEETVACIRFALAVADYVLAMQMEMFGQRLDRQQQDNDVIPVYRSRNTVLFEQLPDQFTLLDASRARRDGAGKETLRKMVYRWMKRGLCERVDGETDLWQKLPLTA